MSEATVTMPIEEYDELRDKYEIMKTKIDELQEFKDMFFETFKLKLSQSHSEYTLKDYAAYVTTKYDLFKKLFMVPNNKELDGITFIK